MQLSIMLIILLQVCFSCALHSYSGYMCLLLCSSVVLVQSLWLSSSTRPYNTLGKLCCDCWQCCFFCVAYIRAIFCVCL